MCGQKESLKAIAKNLNIVCILCNCHKRTMNFLGAITALWLLKEQVLIFGNI